MFDFFFKKKDDIIKIDEKTKKEANEQIISIQLHINTLEKRMEILEQRKKKETENAINYTKKKNILGARSSLKKRKENEKQINLLEKKILNLEKIKFGMETTISDSSTISEINKSFLIQKKINNSLGGADNVHKIMDDNTIIDNEQNEISNLLASPDANDIENDESIEEELNILQNEIKNEEILKNNKKEESRFDKQEKEEIKKKEKKKIKLK